MLSESYKKRMKVWHFWLCSIMNLHRWDQSFRLCEENAARILAARRRAKADPSSVAAARRKSLDFLAENNGVDHDRERREMVARRLSYQHKSDFNADSADEAPYYENTRENRPRSPGYAIVV